MSITFPITHTRIKKKFLLKLLQTLQLLLQRHDVYLRGITMYLFNLFYLYKFVDHHQTFNRRLADVSVRKRGRVGTVGGPFSPSRGKV